MKDHFPDEIANTYEKEALEAYIQYEDIKGSLDYKIKYKLYTGSVSLKKYLLENQSEDASLLNIAEQLSGKLEADIKNKWNITTPISPYLKVSKNDLTKPTIRLTGSLAKILVAYSVISHQKLLTLIERLRLNPTIRYIMFPSTKAKKIAVSDKTFEETKKQQKFLAHFLMKEGSKYPTIGRIFNIDEGTAKRWCKEAASWSDEERETIRCSLFGTKSRRNIDTIGLHHKRRRSFSSVDKVEDDIRDRIDSDLDQ